MTEKLDGAPISGEYEEILFDLPGPWREQIWHYVKFTTKECNTPRISTQGFS